MQPERRAFMRAPAAASGPTAPLMLSFSEALPLTSLSRNTLYSLLKAGEVPGARKLGNTWRFNRMLLLDWLGQKGS